MPELLKLNDQEEAEDLKRFQIRTVCFHAADSLGGKPDVYGRVSSSVPSEKSLLNCGRLRITGILDTLTSTMSSFC